MAIKGNWPNSQKNSTDIPLAAGATFTGGGEAVSVTEWAQSVSVSVYTDAPSANEGLQIQFSADGSNWDHVKKYTISANQDTHVEVNLHYRYFRVVYQTLLAQTVFRLQTRFNQRGAAATVEAPEAVRLVNGEGFYDFARQEDREISMVHYLDHLLREQKKTNLYLAEIAGVKFGNEDIEEKE